MNLVKIIGGVVVAGIMVFGFFTSQTQEKVRKFNNYVISQMSSADVTFQPVTEQVFSWDGTTPFDSAKFESSLAKVKQQQESAKKGIQEFDAKDHELVNKFRDKAVEYIDSNLRLANIYEEIGELFAKEGATPDVITDELSAKLSSESTFNEELSTSIQNIQRQLGAEFEFELK